MFEFARFRSGGARRAPADTGASATSLAVLVLPRYQGPDLKLCLLTAPLPSPRIRLGVVKPFITASAPDSSPP